MNSMVHSQNLFSSIVTAIRDVEEGKGRETVLERKRNKADGAYKPGSSTSKMTSSRQIPIQARNKPQSDKKVPETQAKGRSKFSKRFNMTGNGMSQADDGGRSNLNTPSTSATSPQQDKPREKPSGIKPVAGDLNQWIKKPQGLGVLGQ